MTPKPENVTFEVEGSAVRGELYRPTDGHTAPFDGSGGFHQLAI
jgi:hypothetical protein